MKKPIVRNVSLKILSLLFAVSLWLFANLKATADRSMKLPVILANISAEYVITNTVTDYINVKVDGPWRIISNLNPADFPIRLDLSDAKAGMSTYQINEKMVQLPAGIKVTILFPDTIQVKLEPVVTREVNVKVSIREGVLPDGYVIQNIVCTPKVVSMTGAKSEILALAAVETEEIDPSGRKESFVTEVGLVPKEPHVWSSQKDKKVKVHVIIGEKTIQKEFLSMPVVVNNAPYGATADPSTVDIVLEGPWSKVQKITGDMLHAQVTVPAKKGDSFKLPVVVTLPVDQVKARPRPDSVNVTLRRRVRPQ